MKRFENAKIKDKVYCRLNGFGEIKRIAIGDSDYPIVVIFLTGVLNSYTLGGRLTASSAEAILFYVDGDNQYCEERPNLQLPVALLPIDTKLFVCDVSDYNPSKRHFAYCLNEKICCWSDGRTSFTASMSSPIPWRNAKLAEDVVVNGVIYPEGTQIKL